MNERDLLCSSQRVLDFTNGQQDQNHLHSEPCILLGSTSNFPRSHINQVLPPSGSVNNFDLHHIPEHVGRPAFYGMSQYNQPNHPAANHPNFFNGHLDLASGARVFPVPLNHGFVDHLPSSSNYGGNVGPFNNDHGRCNLSAEGVRELCKRKSSEGIPGNVQHFGASAGPSSSSAAPMTGSHYDSGSASIESSLPLPDYRGNGSSPTMEVVSGARHRSGAVGAHMDSVMVHNYNSFMLQGNYGGQSFQPSSSSWLDQQSISNTISSAGGLTWSGPPMVPYFQGSNIHGGSPELGNGNHGPANFLHSPPVVQQHHNLHPPQNIQGVRGYGAACYPPFLAAPSRVPPSDGMHHDLLSISQESAEPTNRPTGIRIYRSQGRSLVHDVASRRRDLPRFRTLPVDRVAILEFPNFYEVDYDVESIIDHHRDMRLDIDNMSYEELLALSERIGTVNTGLTEKDIRCHLKTRRYHSTSATINLEELPCSDTNNDSCIICQDEYEADEKLGTLECGHEYHLDCLKKWLLLKNVCPICKSVALVSKPEDK
ncbi:probable E3 ubiquitin-protein ligase ZFP1 [Spinacia oleracea]|uniref:RING-type E3 ubiquitin transferase n=1 Tax=Spinacia oleracea TaxID=3562 RepID=A0A9R0HUN8_SPIOL|nr:probable E3 ubiquitin-protein ligase ZFP1 [Spinacia oleracea]XP_021837352.1 probable E3 ubiquitin-protein ligase ZFP1 [Spinacia oleracea]